MNLLLRSICVAAILTVSAACSGSSSSPAAPGTITPIYGSVFYDVSGTAKHVAVSYRNSSGTLVQTGAAVPFFYQWETATAGEPMFISAQIDTPGDAGTITVTILKNGGMVQEIKAAGYLDTATASGTF